MVSQPAELGRAAPVRVLRVIARLNVGGPALHVVLLTAGLQDNAFATTLVIGQVSPSEGDMSYVAEQHGVHPVLIPSLGREISLLDDGAALLALIRLIRRLRPQVVHTHTAKAGLLGRVAAALCGVPVIVHTFHGHVFRGYFGPLKTRLFILLERAAARITTRILTVSPRLRDDLLELHIAPPQRIQVLPLGLDLAPLAAVTRGAGRLRALLGLEAGVPLMGIVGRLAPIKNHDLFLAAAQRVAQALPASHFVIVGDGERRAELEASAARLGLAGQVHFTGWQRDLPGVYADLDVLALTSASEGTPVSLIEAMAAGVPVVATAVGGVPDVLQEGRLGVLVPPGDAAALSQAAIELLTGQRRPDTAAAQRRALEQYGMERLIADMRQLYTDLLSEANARKQIKP